MCHLTFSLSIQPFVKVSIVCKPPQAVLHPWIYLSDQHYLCGEGRCDCISVRWACRPMTVEPVRWTFTPYSTGQNTGEKADLQFQLHANIVTME